MISHSDTTDPERPDDTAEPFESLARVPTDGTPAVTIPLDDEAPEASAEFEVADTAVNRDLQKYRPPVARTGTDLPFDGYLDLTVPEIIDRLDRMSLDEVRAVQRYEGSHRRRKTLMVKLERLTRSLSAGHAPQPAGSAGSGR